MGAHTHIETFEAEIPLEQQRRQQPLEEASGGMSASQMARWLMQHWLFSTLGEDAVRLLTQAMRQRVVLPGEVLQRSGDHAAEFLVVRSGALEVINEQKETTVISDTSVDVRRSTHAGSGAADAGASFSVGPGCALQWSECLLAQPAGATVRCDGNSVATVWVVSGFELRRLAAMRPDLVINVTNQLSWRLANKLGDAFTALKEEERRQRFLEPYLVASPKVGIIGSSKYADRLRKQVISASRDTTRSPVVVVGEAGMCPDHIAALVHFGSTKRNGPIAEIDCSQVLHEEALLSKVFGHGSAPGMLHWLGKDGTLLVNNAHMASPCFIERLQHLLQHGTYRPLPPTTSPPSSCCSTRGGSCCSSKASGCQSASGCGGECQTQAAAVPQTQQPAERTCSTRILLASEISLPAFDGLVGVITVPPLRLRPADAVALQRFYVKRASRNTAERVQLALTPEAERQVQAYGFPAGKVELQAAVLRAVSQSRQQPKGSRGASPSGSADHDGAAAARGGSPAGQVTLDQGDFWGVSQESERFKIDLLSCAPWLRDFIRSGAFPEGLNHGFTKYAFGALLLGLVLGPQDRDHNGFLNLFWDWWWPGMFLLYPFAGRLWCSICPFMIWGQAAQRWRLATDSAAKLIKWPTKEIESWSGWFMLSLFGAILVWEEVWDLPNNATLSAALLLLITSGAVACSWFFEKRMWCRFLCPIGAMNGLMAKFSMTEVRGRQGVCSGSCSTYACIKGGPGDAATGSLPTEGCPMQYHSAKLQDNSMCVLCMSCIQACPNSSIELRLRPPSIDLWTTHVPKVYESSLMFMLLGASYLRMLPSLASQLGLSPDLFAHKTPHILVSAAVLAAPGLIAWCADATSRAALKAAAQASDGAVSADALLPAPFLWLSYGYLPIVGGFTLASYLGMLMGEGGEVLRVFARMVGLSDEVAASLPGFVASDGAIGFAQGCTLLASAVLSLALTRKLSGKPWGSVAPQSLLILAFTAEMWSVLFRC